MLGVMAETTQKPSNVISKRMMQDDEDPPDIPDEVTFKNSLKLFQRLVDKTVAQKREERLGLYVKDDEEMDYDKFYAAVLEVFGTGVKTQDVKTFFRKISNNPDGRTEWCEITKVPLLKAHIMMEINCENAYVLWLFNAFKMELTDSGLNRPFKIFGYYIVESDVLASQLDEENMVFMVSKKQRITKAGVKRRDVIKCIVKIPQLDFMVTASQKGMLSIFSSQMRILTSTSIPDSSWITGCDYLSQLKRVVAITERTIIVWDYKTQGTAMDNCFIIKPMEHCLICVCAVQRPAELLVKDDILLGDDGGYVNMFTMTSDDFGLKQSKSKKQKQIVVLDSKKFRNIKRKLHDDWVVRVKYIPALNCFGSCSLDSVHSLVLDDLKRLEDNVPVRDFSVPKGVNAFTYCVKANIVVTGGDDKVLRLWHPNINTKPVGKLLGHLFSITEIVTNEKDQHIISLSTAKIFRVWDIQTLSVLQVFHDSQGGPKETQIFAMIFDNNHGSLIAGSTVIDIYPLTRMIQDTKQVPQTHERSINVLVYNKVFHQVLTICSESIIKVWELETGQLIYQIQDAHGSSVELTCAAVDRNGFHLATGACDGTVKIWDFGSGQELKILPLGKEIVDNEHWLMQMVYLKASESKHVILVLEYSGTIKIVQGNEGEPYLSITWELPEAVSLAIQGNPLMSLKLTLNTKKNNGFYPDVELLPDKEPVTSNPEIPCGIEVICFDLLRVEGYNLLATASANGAIMVWDFESATTRYIFKAGHAVQVDGPELLRINKLLFLYRSSLSDRVLWVDDSLIPLSNNLSGSELLPRLLPLLCPNFPQTDGAAWMSSKTFQSLKKRNPVAMTQLPDNQTWMTENLHSHFKIEAPIKVIVSRMARQLSWSSTFSSDPQSDESHTQEEDSTVAIKLEGDKSERSGMASASGLGPGSLILENKPVASSLLAAGSEKAEPQNIPILVAAHEDGRIYLWTIMGELLRELLPFTKHPPIPITVLCTGASAKMLFAANKEGHVIRWNVGSFLDDPLDGNKHVKQQICWRAHSTKIVDLFFDEEKNLVVTASIDSSVRLWNSYSGHYLGYFGQHRLFEMSESCDIILPCDVNETPFTIKEDSKYMEKKQKFEYPLVLDREKWKTLTRSSLTLKKPGPYEVDQDFKFFKALASPKIHKQPLDIFRLGNKETGVVFGTIPIYKVSSPQSLRTLSGKPDASVDNIRKRSRTMYNSPSRLSLRRAAKSSQAPMTTPSSPAAPSADPKNAQQDEVLQ